MRSACQEYAPPAPLARIHAELLQRLDAAAAQWFGRGATALYWAYQLASPQTEDRACKPEIIVPAMMCATPANAARLAGFQPRFADVDDHTGMVTLEQVRARWTPQTRAVLFVHLFGQTADLTSLAHWCSEHDALLIEDAAQAQGALLPDGSPAGSVGDLSVFSFNPTKLLEAGGGLLVIRQDELVERLTGIQAAGNALTQVDRQRAAELASSYRNLHHSMAALLRLGASPQLVADAFMRLVSHYDGLWVKNDFDPAALANAWPTLTDKISERKRKADIYAEELNDGPWELLTGYRQSGVCWRFSLLANLPHHVVETSEAVRRDGFHVSNLYWPINQFFRPADECPNADRFARRILNLWVDDSIDEAWVRRCAASLRKHGRRLADEDPVVDTIRERP